ncbi:hypothetical protein THASP1DRAFT_26460 [Thamnocephalis sphaerospora]|uniref:Uncharacterized protein n=1 Tax=Thamnocephalis sphaerospora TaxID=78915 RepID=A0A4P9XI35_9FUNG|nr:hypothetical protein THASP1DRAFT_26460 [Thamnocephalis sphaerospora]|eukprot:RKP04981.1 hypothetical protein THASP1DRAFT_26460 [Thamnocephalis sphaerospora]
MTPYIEDVDLSGLMGINMTLVQPSPYSRVIGDWEAISFGSPSEYQEIAMGLALVVILGLRFCYNTYLAAKMLYNRREWIFWLNFIQAAVCVLFATTTCFQLGKAL